MLLVSAKLPDVAFEGTKIPRITPNDMCTIFNLELSVSPNNKICQLIFLFPDHLQSFSPYLYFREGSFTFTGYDGVGATQKTTYNNQPLSGPKPPNPPNVPKLGNAYVINSEPCPPLTSSTTVSGLLCSKDTMFSFFQSDAKCLLGFFVRLLDE